MSRRPAYNWDALATELFDQLVATPDGLDRHQIRARLNLPRAKPVYKIIRTLRMALGHGDVINVSLKRDGNRAVYFLAGTVDDVQPYTHARLQEQLSKLEGLAAVWSSIAAGIDGRTVDGKVARHVLRYLTRLVEDVRIELDGT